VRHPVQRQCSVGSPCENPRRGHSRWGEAFTDEKDDAERFLDNPMLEIKNAKSREENEAEKREQLVAPFHEADL
jgi:hypothetical protein